MKAYPIKMVIGGVNSTRLRPEKCDRSIELPCNLWKPGKEGIVNDARYIDALSV